jgi:hypothetical protein
MSRAGQVWFPLNRVTVYTTWMKPGTRRPAVALQFGRVVWLFSSNRPSMADQLGRRGLHDGAALVDGVATRRDRGALRSAFGRRELMSVKLRWQCPTQA